MKQIFLEQPRRGNTHEVQLTPHKAEGRNAGPTKAYEGHKVGPTMTSAGRSSWAVAIILLILSVLATACSKPEKQALEGTWQWTQTSGGLAGVNYTPESEGFNAEIVFKGSHFTFYKDGEKVISGTYHIDNDVDETMYTNKGGKDEPLYSWFHIRFNLTDAQCKKISEATEGKISLLCGYKCLGTLGNSEAEGQVLTISDNMTDGFTYAFVKKQ